MIATGTDVKPIECVFFMRDVRSGTYFEQMKGRGARTIDDATFATMTPDAKHKTRFVIVDAVGVTEHPFVDAAPMERSKSISLEALLNKAAASEISLDETSSLASRLARLSRELSKTENEELENLARMPLTQITQQLIKVNDPDLLNNVLESAPRNNLGQKNEALAIRNFLDELLKPLQSNPELRQRILNIKKFHELIFDETSRDFLRKAGGVVDTSKAKNIVDSWKQYIEENKNEITAIQLIYSQPKGLKITYKELKELTERIKLPHPTWTLDLIWNAYLALEPGKVRKSAVHTITDLVSLLRYTFGQMNELIPYSELVEIRYANWLLQQENHGAKFTEKQKWWLDNIKEAIIQGAQFDVKDLELSPFTERGGTAGVLAEIGDSVTELIMSMNMELAS
jgi:type I restriction enzyme R subunit